MHRVISTQGVQLRQVARRFAQGRSDLDDVHLEPKFLKGLLATGVAARLDSFRSMRSGERGAGFRIKDAIRGDAVSTVPSHGGGRRPGLGDQELDKR